ncbi:VCBS repeat-containing protein [Microbacterium sp. X-17]|uniref:FG-GAP repeat domain-containing protein n=1 Tax=Microbacterium sp. X-17 TaxID=3144404 RepID=UPI0031F52BAC
MTRTRTRRPGRAALASALALAVAVVLGGAFVAPAGAASTVSPPFVAVAATVDCSALSNGGYRTLRLTATFAGLTPGDAYQASLQRSAGESTPYQPGAVAVDAQGGGTADTTLTSVYVKSNYPFVAELWHAGAVVATAPVTTNDCESGISPAGAPTVGYDCPSRYLTPHGVEGTAIRVQGTLSGYLAGHAYTLNDVSGTRTATAAPDGTLTFDRTVDYPAPQLSGRALTWTVTAVGRQGDVAQGTVTATDTCPPLAAGIHAKSHDSDITGDGYGDLLAIDGGGRLLLYANGIRSNAGGAPFSTGRVVGSGWSLPAGPKLPALGDINGDGFADLVAIRSDGALVEYPNGIAHSATGSPYSSGLVIGSGWSNFFTLAVGDINGDGYADIVGSTPWGWYQYLNVSASDPQHRPFVSGSLLTDQIAAGPGQVLGDLNGDGYADLVDAIHAVHPNRTTAGTPGFGSLLSDAWIPQVADGGQAWRGWSIADVEGTGRSGLLIASPNGNGQLVYVPSPLDGQNGTPASRVVGSGWNAMQSIIG